MDFAAVSGEAWTPEFFALILQFLRVTLTAEIDTLNLELQRWKQRHPVRDDISKA